MLKLRDAHSQELKEAVSEVRKEAVMTAVDCLFLLVAIALLMPLLFFWITKPLQNKMVEKAKEKDVRE